MNDITQDDIKITRPFLGSDPYNQLTISGLNSNMVHSIYLDQDEFIEGQMIQAQVIVKDFEITQMHMDPDSFKRTMKKRLAEMIAEKLLDDKLVEFTKQEDLHTNETTFRARAYLVQDDHVRVLRKTLK
jgi:hypothetical protein